MIGAAEIARHLVTAAPVRPGQGAQVVCDIGDQLSDDLLCFYGLALDQWQRMPLVLRFALARQDAIRIEDWFAITLANNARGQNADIAKFQPRLIARFGSAVCINENQIDPGVALHGDGKLSRAGKQCVRCGSYRDSIRPAIRVSFAETLDEKKYRTVHGSRPASMRTLMRLLPSFRTRTL